MGAGAGAAGLAGVLQGVVAPFLLSILSLCVSAMEGPGTRRLMPRPLASLSALLVHRFVRTKVGWGAGGATGVGSASMLDIPGIDCCCWMLSCSNLSIMEVGADGVIDGLFSRSEVLGDTCSSFEN